MALERITKIPPEILFKRPVVIPNNVLFAGIPLFGEKSGGNSKNENKHQSAPQVKDGNWQSVYES